MTRVSVGLLRTTGLLAPLLIGVWLTTGSCRSKSNRLPVIEGRAMPAPNAHSSPRAASEEPSRIGGRVLPELQPRLGEPLTGLSSEELARFWKGRELFNRAFRASEGLGPTYNLFGCGVCHSNPVGGSGTLSVTLFGRVEDGRFDPLVERGGPILQAEHEDPRCVERVPEEANVMTQHLATSILGGGLVEAIPDAAIEKRALEPPLGVSGRVNRSRPYEVGPGAAERIGRFGWKSQFATLLSFSAHAALNEVGITNRYFPAESAPNGDVTSLAFCDPVPDPEDRPDAEGVEMLDRWVDFQRFLAPPPQTPRSGLLGESVFERIGCADCHAPEFVTADDPSLPAALRARSLRPYSDYLVHDMGSGADGVAMGLAGTSEMRTAPLWGFRIRFPNWHDGRISAATLRERLRESVERHDGEGAAARERFRQLAEPEIEELLRFIDSLGRVEFDFDGDNDVDAADYAEVFECLTGERPGAFDRAHRCALADIDPDGDVDLVDMALLQRAFTGDRSGSAVIVP